MSRKENYASPNIKSENHGSHRKARHPSSVSGNGGFDFSEQKPTIVSRSSSVPGVLAPDITIWFPKS